MESLYGETIPTIGKGLDADSEGYDGIIVIGPFNCLPYRISEAILKPLSLQRGTPNPDLRKRRLRRLALLPEAGGRPHPGGPGTRRQSTRVGQAEQEETEQAEAIFSVASVMDLLPKRTALGHAARV